jgi:hypothetical protein
MLPAQVNTPALISPSNSTSVNRIDVPGQRDVSVKEYSD